MRNKLRREIIKQRLKEELLNSKMSFIKIAKMVGINPAMLTQYCNTDKMPSVETLSKIWK